MEKTAVDYLIKEFSEILGRINTTPMQDLLMVDAINKAKEMEKEQIMGAYNEGIWERKQNEGEQYYNETFKQD